MTHRLFAAALALPLLLAPADARAGGTTASGPVAEIVTFRLVEGTDPTTFLAAAEATAAPLTASAGFLTRRLSVDDTGLWTDYVEWSDLASASAAAEAMMTNPAFGPFMALINPEGLQMRHAQTLWTMGD